MRDAFSQAVNPASHAWSVRLGCFGADHGEFRIFSESLIAWCSRDCASARFPNQRWAAARRQSGGADTIEASKYRGRARVHKRGADASDSAVAPSEESVAPGLRLSAQPSVKRFVGPARAAPSASEPIRQLRATGTAASWKPQVPLLSRRAIGLSAHARRLRQPTTASM